MYPLIICRDMPSPINHHDGKHHCFHHHHLWCQDKWRRHEGRDDAGCPILCWTVWIIASFIHKTHISSPTSNILFQRQSTRRPLVVICQCQWWLGHEHHDREAPLPPPSTLEIIVEINIRKNVTNSSSPTLTKTLERHEGRDDTRCLMLYRTVWFITSPDTNSPHHWL